jgi:hypothetical protein
MRRLHLCLATIALAFAFASVGAASGDAEWDAAAAAAQQADPTIVPPVPELDSVTVVGGTSTGSTKAVAAKKREGQATGRMTEILGFGNSNRARVICVAAVAPPDGPAYAKVVGELEEPVGDQTFLTFRLLDSGNPGGAEDAWDSQLNDVQPPCVAEPPAAPIDTGNVVIDPG